jgi:hypothetical protein
MMNLTPDVQYAQRLLNEAIRLQQCLADCGIQENSIPDLQCHTIPQARIWQSQNCSHSTIEPLLQYINIIECHFSMFSNQGVMVVNQQKAKQINTPISLQHARICGTDLTPIQPFDSVGYASDHGLHFGYDPATDCAVATFNIAQKGNIRNNAFGAVENEQHSQARMQRNIDHALSYGCDVVCIQEAHKLQPIAGENYQWVPHPNKNNSTSHSQGLGIFLSKDCQIVDVTQYGDDWHKIIFQKNGTIHTVVNFHRPYKGGLAPLAYMQQQQRAQPVNHWYMGDLNANSHPLECQRLRSDPNVYLPVIANASRVESSIANIQHAAACGTADVIMFPAPTSRNTSAMNPTRCQKFQDLQKIMSTTWHPDVAGILPLKDDKVQQYRQWQQQQLSKWHATYNQQPQQQFQFQQPQPQFQPQPQPQPPFQPQPQPPFQPQPQPPFQPQPPQYPQSQFQFQQPQPQPKFQQQPAQPQFQPPQNVASSSQGFMLQPQPPQQPQPQYPQQYLQPQLQPQPQSSYFGAQHVEQDDAHATYSVHNWSRLISNLPSMQDPIGRALSHKKTIAENPTMSRPQWSLNETLQATLTHEAQLCVTCSTVPNQYVVRSHGLMMTTAIQAELNTQDNIIVLDDALTPMVNELMKVFNEQVNEPSDANSIKNYIKLTLVTHWAALLSAQAVYDNAPVHEDAERPKCCITLPVIGGGLFTTNEVQKEIARYAAYVTGRTFAQQHPQTLVNVVHYSRNDQHILASVRNHHNMNNRDNFQLVEFNDSKVVHSMGMHHQLLPGHQANFCDFRVNVPNKTSIFCTGGNIHTIAAAQGQEGLDAAQRFLFIETSDDHKKNIDQYLSKYPYQASSATSQQLFEGATTRNQQPALSLTLHQNEHENGKDTSEDSETDAFWSSNDGKIIYTQEEHNEILLDLLKDDQEEGNNHNREQLTVDNNSNTNVSTQEEENNHNREQLTVDNNSNTNASTQEEGNNHNRQQFTVGNNNNVQVNTQDQTYVILKEKSTIQQSNSLLHCLFTQSGKKDFRWTLFVNVISFGLSLPIQALSAGQAFSDWHGVVAAAFIVANCLTFGLLLCGVANWKYHPSSRFPPERSKTMHYSQVIVV